jgi:ParB family chromosome partitioning protein
MLQPVIVRPIPESERPAMGADGDTSIRFELIAGERRWRAAKMAGLATVPAIVRAMDDQESGLAALIENVQREDLNPIERSDGLQRLIDEFGLTHQELATRVALDRSSVTNLLRLKDLDPFTRDSVRSGRLSQGHAKALLAIADPGVRRQMAAATIAGDWSVRELERRVRLLSAERETSPVAAIPAPSAPSAHVADLERRLSEHLGSRVRIQLGRKKGTGRVVLEFFNLDQFDGLLSKLGFESTG